MNCGDAVDVLMKRLHEQLHDTPARTCLDDKAWESVETTLKSAFEAGELHAATRGDSYATLLLYAGRWDDKTKAVVKHPGAQLIRDAFLDAARDVRMLRRRDTEGGGQFDEAAKSALNFFKSDDNESGE